MYGLGRKGGKRMGTRKIIQNRGSQYINIPREIQEALGTEKGERLKVAYAPGVGIVMTQLGSADKIAGKKRTIKELQKEVDLVYDMATRKLRKMKDSQVQDFHTAMMKEFVKFGIVDLKIRVNGLEKEAAKIKAGRGKLSLVVRRKKGE